MCLYGSRGRAVQYTNYLTRAGPVTRLCPISSSTLVRNLPLPIPIPHLQPHPHHIPSFSIESKSIFTTRSFLWRIHVLLQKYIRLNKQSLLSQSLLPNYERLATSPITTTTRSRSRSVPPRSHLKFCKTDPRQWLRPRYIPLQGVLSFGSCSFRSSSILGRIPAVTKRGTIRSFSYMPACFVVVEL
jgi:hypothetical protein